MRNDCDLHACWGNNEEVSYPEKPHFQPYAAEFSCAQPSPSLYINLKEMVRKEVDAYLKELGIK